MVSRQTVHAVAAALLVFALPASGIRRSRNASEKIDLPVLLNESSTGTLSHIREEVLPWKFEKVMGLFVSKLQTPPLSSKTVFAAAVVAMSPIMAMLIIMACLALIDRYCPEIPGGGAVAEGHHYLRQPHHLRASAARQSQAVAWQVAMIAERNPLPCASKAA
mmetsp:Transcript_105690/g.329389  ORF Transcript_105690/g.329389 Transcript_105690/m.329389 type:complete len:163 (-) Transcript_105690:33-521(-)|eukprot:CAMPEP_0204609200 /NCGR_PEP_ID=MMETSP0661-20131031/60773_1 /ASSEMBLY_ACC=CAM_ASM_000606 /TAXON_ID=109239 /ORGANISM="Alexandrium margalefi, Strain AMGDE01CS-322" /LENGTH=162 /DNA_ID=CAMNT_0051620831 /DNA_START=73 /DNA_END=561 /DNA_ORIENTATION=+